MAAKLKMIINNQNLKSFWLWIYNHVVLKYWHLRYRTTLLSLARLTLLILAKEIVIPWVYACLVIVNGIWPHEFLLKVIVTVAVLCIPSFVEIFVCILAVIVFLVVAFVQYKTEQKKINRDNDLFTSVYVQYSDELFKRLHIENYNNWSYRIAVSGSPFMIESQYDEMVEAASYLKGRVKHDEFSDIDLLYQNIALLIDDFHGVFEEHIEVHHGSCFVERFYKNPVPNPNYEEDLAEYEYIVRLCSDLIFELTRLCNLLLVKMRNRQPDYQLDAGVLMVDGILEHSVYRDYEISDSPYPGLEEFKEIRKIRSYCLG